MHLQKMPQSDEEYRDQIAQLRFALIAPLVQGTYAEESKSAYARRVSLIPVTMPDGTEMTPAPKTIMRWYERYLKEGIAALKPKERCDKGGTRVLSLEVQTRIQELRDEFPKMNCVVMHERLLEEGTLQDVVSISTIQRFVKKLKITAPHPGEVKDRRKFEAPYPNAMWQADTKYYPRLTEGPDAGRRLHMITIVDDHSRLLAGGELFFEDNAVNFMQVLKHAVTRFGIPQKIYVDNGSPYKNSQLSNVCAALGIILIHTPPYDGQSKGKCERLHRTLQERAIHAVEIEKITSREQYQQIVDDEGHRYNRAMHSSINDTPLHRWSQGMDNIRKVTDLAQPLDECFEQYLTRKVRNDATVTVGKIYYDVPAQFIGQTVKLHYLPDDPATFWIRRDGQRFEVRRTDPVANGRTPRQKYPDVNYGMEARNK